MSEQRVDALDDGARGSELEGGVTTVTTNDRSRDDERAAVEPRRSRSAGGVQALYSGNAWSVVSRGLIAARSSSWAVILSGFFEPVFYLLAMGVGLGTYIGDVTTTSGRSVDYAAYIAPALLAVSAMNGAVYDSTWNVFFKMHYAKLYNAQLSTSLGPLDVALGEIIYALLRGVVYAAGFLTVMQVMGLNLSWTAAFALPAVALIAFGFASIGMAITSRLTRFQQMDMITVVMLPMFLFSATFYPLTVYPEAVQWVIKALPLWHGVEMIRSLTTGSVDGSMVVHVAYYVAMVGVGVTLTTRRLRTLFLA